MHSVRQHIFVSRHTSTHTHTHPCTLVEVISLALMRHLKLRSVCVRRHFADTYIHISTMFIHSLAPTAALWQVMNTFAACHAHACPVAAPDVDNAVSLKYIPNIQLHSCHVTWAWNACAAADRENARRLTHRPAGKTFGREKRLQHAKCIISKKRTIVTLVADLAHSYPPHGVDCFESTASNQVERLIWQFS